VLLASDIAVKAFNTAVKLIDFLGHRKWRDFLLVPASNLVLKFHQNIRRNFSFQKSYQQLFLLLYL